jgi:hypothetical protein
MSDDALLEKLLQAIQPAAPANVDRRTGAPANVRAAVGAAQTEEDRLATLRRAYPDAKPFEAGNFIFTNPRTGRPTVYNPKGLDFGDVASIGPEIGEMAGGAVGGALALPPAVAGAPATGGLSLAAVPVGVGLGAAAGRQLVTTLASQLGGTVDTRGPVQHFADAGVTAGTNAVMIPAGQMLASAGRAALGPVARQFGGQTGRNALADFDNAGVTPTAGAVTGNRTVQLAEKGLENLPGGAQPIRDVAEQQAAQLGNEASRIANAYGAPADPAQVGATLKAGAAAAVARFEARQGELYDEAFRLIGPDMPVVLPSVQRLGGEIQSALQAAPESRARVLQPVLDRIAAIDADAGAGLRFDALRAVRTDLGRLIGGSPNAASAPSSDTMVYMRQLYGALTDDMTAAARQAGPDAERALAVADRYTRINRGQNMPVLEKILTQGTDDQVYRLAFPANGKPDAQALMRIRRNMQPEEWNTLSATVLDRMGMPTPGVAGAGDGFSVSTFLTNWNKLRASGDAARHVLFGGGQNARLAPELDRLARVAERLKDVERLANPPGTARNLIMGGGMLAMGNELASGDVKGAAMIAGLGIVAPRYGARLITDPAFVRWLSGAATATTAQASDRALVRLGAVAEANPELREAIEAFRLTFSPSPQQGASRPSTAPRG